MTPDDTPQGTVTDTPAPLPGQPPRDALDDAVDSILDDPEEDTGEAEPGQQEPDEEGSDEEQPEEGEPTDEDDAEEEDGGQPRDEKGRFLSDDAKVRLDDGSVVTVKELRQGSLRQADYTRKTQELAEQRRSFEERNRRAEQLESQLAAEREYTRTLLNSVAPQPPDPAKLQTDPLGYIEAKANYDNWQAHLANLQKQDVEARQRRQQMTAEQRQAVLQKERDRLLEVEPTFKDPAKFEAFRGDVLKFGTETYGFSPQELSVTDHRYVRVLKDAIAYRKLQAQKPKAQEKAQGKPPVSPGRRQAPEAAKLRTREKDRQTLKATGGKGQNGEAALDRLLDKFV